MVLRHILSGEQVYLSAKHFWEMLWINRWKHKERKREIRKWSNYHILIKHLSTSRFISGVTKAVNILLFIYGCLKCVITGLIIITFFIFEKLSLSEKASSDHRPYTSDLKLVIMCHPQDTRSLNVYPLCSWQGDKVWTLLEVAHWHSGLEACSGVNGKMTAEPSLQRNTVLHMIQHI